MVQDFLPENFEIIVVDNVSKDNTLNVAKKFAREYPGLVRIIMEKHIQSSYAARNKGINASEGSIIAFIDANMSVEKDWLSKIVNSLEKNQVEYFACKVEIYLKEKNVFGYYFFYNFFNIFH
ncbi:hypothetical protein ES708_29390 [subsurface metagenome]